MKKIKYVESNIPSHVRVVVTYVSRLRHEDQPEDLPLWRTTCMLIDQRTRQLVGYAQTDCTGDRQPAKKIGRAIAVGRAFKGWVVREGHPHMVEENTDWWNDKHVERVFPDEFSDEGIRALQGM